MTNMTKDYYKILGISENSTDQEIKSAYRKLARKWHPDVAGNSTDVVNKFKEINEAYEVLSDKVKKSEYDTINRFYNYSSTRKSTEKKYEKTENTTRPDFKNTHKEEKHEENKSSNFNINWEDFISKYKEYTKKFNDLNNNNKNNTKNTASSSNTKQNTNAKYGNIKRGKDINTDVEITIAEAISGTVKVINMISTHECEKCGGRKFINGALCRHCNGTGEKSEYKRFTVRIPAGVKDNSKIRLSEEGEPGINGGKNGDLYITVHIKAPVEYKTDGNNIIKTLTITPHEAVLGGNVSVKTFDGNINVKISPNTQNGQKIRLSGCGINVNGKIGDMILIVEIQIPKNLSEEEIELYRKLREISSQNVR